MRKRPIAHWDPALATAHVLLAYRAPYNFTETQTSTVLRDLMDNDTWKWLQRPGGADFALQDTDWIASAWNDITRVKQDQQLGYLAIGRTNGPNEYKRLKQQFLSRLDEAYFGAGTTALHERYRSY